MAGHHPSEPEINVQVKGDHNVIIVAGDDVNRWPAWREEDRLPRTATLRGRLGRYAAGALVVAAGALLRGSAPASPPPAPAPLPAAATALCGDEPISDTRAPSGTCSPGGVAQWRYPTAYPWWQERAGPPEFLPRACPSTATKMAFDRSRGADVRPEMTGDCRATPITAPTLARGRG